MHIRGQGACTPRVVDTCAAAVHPLYMIDDGRHDRAGRSHNHVRAWREHRKLTLEQLADKVGVSHATIQRIESGKQNYTIKILESIADALGTDTGSLLLHDPKEAGEMWSSWRRASTEQKRVIADVVKSIVDLTPAS